MTHQQIATGTHTAARPSRHPAEPDFVDDIDTGVEADTTPSPAPVPAGNAKQRRYTPDHYAQFLTPGGGAKKLADSQVAPLVALSRGNESVSVDPNDTTSRDKYRELSARYNLPDIRKNQGKAFKASLDAGDVLVMPWWSVTQVIEGTDRPTVVQYRPQVPAVDDTGKERKYEFVAGSANVLGLHPATPHSWIRDRNRAVLLAEGQLKADSALTGALLAAGVSFDQLLVRKTDTPEKARAKLTKLLESVADATIPLVVEMAGIHNWKSAMADLNRLKLDGRGVWVGVDGDLVDNLSVYKATSALWDTIIRYGGKPLLLSPVGMVGSSQGKVGIDDYLAQHGDWNGLLAMITGTLPQPAQADDWGKVDTIRVSDDMTFLEKCVAIKDPVTDTITRIEWQPQKVEMGGRVKAISTTRYPTRTEIESGVYQPELAARSEVESSESVEIEIGWRDPDTGEREVAVVTGPATLLSFTPDQWVRNGAKVPQRLAMHKQWPLAGEEARQFLSAIKGFRTDEVVDQVRWMRNGWVPVPNHPIPAFVIGDQKVCDLEQDDEVISAVDRSTLNQISGFGLGEQITSAAFDDKRYQKQLRSDIETLIETFIRNKPWSNPGTAPLIIAAGLRPALPIETQVTMLITGRAGSGKSWTAAALMSFLAHNKGAWTSDQLPGSVSADSEAATANARSQTVAWVMDDLSPSSNPQTASRDIAKVENLIRQQFNGRGPGRMNQDGSTRMPRDPHGLFVVTAENKVATKSILQRCLLLPTPKGALADDREKTQALMDLYLHDTLPARVTQGLVKFVREKLAHVEGGWPAMIEEMKSRRQTAKAKRIRAWKKETTDAGLATRSGELLGDLFLPLDYMVLMMEELGMDESWTSELGNRAKLAADGVIREGLREQEENSLSKSLLTAISQGLAAGHCHVVSVPDPTAPPGDGDKQIASRLGWQVAMKDEMKPRGDLIGHYLVNPADDEPYLLLDATAAFQMVAKHYPNEIGGAGVTKQAAWNAFYEDKLFHPGVTRRTKKDSKGVDRFMNYSEVRVAKTSLRLNGVPVRLDDMLHPGDVVIVDDGED